MKKRLAVLFSLALILSLCGMFAGAFASEAERNRGCNDEGQYEYFRSFRRH